MWLIVKLYIKGLVTGVISGAVLMSSVAVFAEDGIEAVKAFLRKDLAVTYNGTKVQLDNSAASIDGKTYLNLRDLGKVFDKNVNWNGKTNTVEISDKKVGQGASNTIKESVEPIIKDEVNSSKILYNEEDVQKMLIKKYDSIDYNKSMIFGKVKNDQIVKTYDGVEFIAKPNIDYFYDRINDKTYYTREFYTQFLSSEDLITLIKYNIQSTGEIVESK